MKRKILALLLMAIITLNSVAYGEIVDRIVAIVNDDIITLKDLEKYVHVEKQGRYTSVNEYFKNIKLREKLDIFIDDLLIRQQAKKLKIEVTDKDVEFIIESIKKQHLITDTQLREQLKRENITYEDFFNGIKINQLKSRVLARVLSPEVFVTEDMLKRYYEKHLDEFKEEEFRLKHIFISNERKDANKIALKVYNLLQEGKNFEDLAREFSDDPSSVHGGDLGFVKKEDLIPELRDALHLIMPGSYTHIVKTVYGFHILKLVEVKKGEVIPYDEVKLKIHERIVQEETEKRYRGYIEKLRKSSYIEVKI